MSESEMLKNTPLPIFICTVLILIGTKTYASTAPSMALCVKAVANGQTYIEAKQQIALQRKSAGSLSEEAYLAELQLLDQQKNWLTLDTCMASLGDQVNLYQCLVDNAGNMKICNE